MVAWMARDAEAQLSYWTQTENNSFVIITADKVYRANNWEERVASAKEGVKDLLKKAKEM